MRLKTVVKLGTVVSVLLFALAVGYYAFMRLDMTGQHRDVNLFSLVPASCISVLESDDVDAFWREYPNLNYSRELDEFQFPGLFHFLISELNEYTDDTHGLSKQMSRLLVSFHHPGTNLDQVVYFHIDMEDEHLISDMLQEYVPGNFLPKEEVYRGKTLRIYPLAHDEFLTTYTEKGFVVLSYQKRLIEEVIDARLDKKSLNDDDLFSTILQKKKSQDLVTLYGREASLPFLNLGSDCWSEYGFYMNSDVVYLMGETYLPENADCLKNLPEHLAEVPVVREEGLMISAKKDSTAFYMNEAFDANDGVSRSLFNECVANLSNEASFSLVADMAQVEKDPARLQTYLPSFVLDNVGLFRSFILSAQLTLSDNRLSHIWVFTYKD